MRVLVEILHPAHVHFFKYAIREWMSRGDEVLVLSREKECANDLLRAYEIPFTSISKLGRHKSALIPEMIERDLKMLTAALKFKPDVLAGIMGVTIAQVGRIIRKPAVVFYDTQNAGITNRFVYPLAHSVCTPDCYNSPVNGNHVTYPGYHELAYLHPDRFTPDVSIVEKHGLDPNLDYFVARFVSWQASHDVGEAGLSGTFKCEMVEKLAERGRVIISSEGELPDKLRNLAQAFPPEDMHHIMAFARMIVGESATMSSEAAVMGVPAVYISDTGRCYTDDEEKYGMVFNFKTTQRDEVMRKLNELLEMPDSRSVFTARRNKLLEDKVETTAWVMNYLDDVVRKIGKQ